MGPRCRRTGASISDFIANTQATGAMAASSFYPCLHMWLNAQQVRRKRLIYPTLIGFQTFFGLFLICPITQVGRLHALSVLCFCPSALAHYAVMMAHCARTRFRLCQALLCAGWVTFLIMFVLGVIANVSETFLIEHCPLLFYIVEASGLSSMMTFPSLWYRERRQAEDLADAQSLQAQSMQSLSFESAMESSPA